MDGRTVGPANHPGLSAQDALDQAFPCDEVKLVRLNPESQT